MAHELAHIWLGESGVSDTYVDSKNTSEVKCNAIAALLLVPTNKFLKLWDSSKENQREKIRVLNKLFKVSELVIARTALTHKRIDRDLYNIVELDTKKAWRLYKDKNKGKEVRLPAITTVSMRNSKTITNKVIDLIKSNKIMPREAGILLNKSAVTVVNL